MTHIFKELQAASGPRRAGHHHSTRAAAAFNGFSVRHSYDYRFFAQGFEGFAETHDPWIDFVRGPKIHQQDMILPVIDGAGEQFDQLGMASR